MDVRKKLVELLTEFYGCDPMYYDVDALAIAQHLIDNGVTVRKKGEWKLVEFQSSPLDTDQALVCSCCGFAHPYDAWFNRCPNCGADMRTEEDG